MNGLGNEFYAILLVISNAIAILQLVAAINWPRVAKISFFLLFTWASWTNWTTSQQHPEFYLEYAGLAWSNWYVDFINGWFADNIKLLVGIVAICQGLIAISMLLKGWLFKAGCIGAMIFLISILPLGIGSGFPCTAIMAIAIYILLKKHSNQFIGETNKIAIA
jgi:hypothetical protein